MSLRVLLCAALLAALGVAAQDPKPPKERVTYDAHRRDLFVTCFESDMERVKATRPQDQPDERVFVDDSVEVFLPGG